MAVPVGRGGRHDNGLRIVILPMTPPDEFAAAIRIGKCRAVQM